MLQLRLIVLLIMLLMLVLVLLVLVLVLVLVLLVLLLLLTQRIVLLMLFVTILLGRPLSRGHRSSNRGWNRDCGQGRRQKHGERRAKGGVFPRHRETPPRIAAAGHRLSRSSVTEALCRCRRAHGKLTTHGRARHRHRCDRGELEERGARKWCRRHCCRRQCCCLPGLQGQRGERWLRVRHRATHSVV